MHPWQNIKEPQSYKRYGLKTSTSDKVGQGCLRFFTTSQSLSPKIAKCNSSLQLLDRQRSSWGYKLQTYLPRAANQLSATSVLIQQNQHGKLCRNVVQAVQGADEVGTESFVSVQFLIHPEQYANTCMAVLDVRLVKVCFLFEDKEKF